MRARDNPFSVERIGRIRYRPLNTTFEQILADLHHVNYRAAIVGPEGSGKTTLLEDLQVALNERNFQTRLVFVNDTQPLTDAACRQLLAELSPDEIILLDGADAIARSAWRLLRHRTILHARGLIVTTHRPSSLPTLIECHTALELLENIVTDLLPHSDAICPDLLARLFANRHGNLRECLRDLYEHFAAGARA